MTPNCRHKKALQDRVEDIQQCSATPSLHLGGCKRVLHALNPFGVWNAGVSSRYLVVNNTLGIAIIITSIKIIKNEVGCRDDTVPKTGDTRSHCEVELTIFRNPQKRDVGRGIAEDCCILLTLPHSAFLCHLFLARCHPYIYLCLFN